VASKYGTVPIFRWEESPWDESEGAYTQYYDLYVGSHLVSSRIPQWDTNEYLELAMGVFARLIGEGLRD
jgi:hypothetical protein